MTFVVDKTSLYDPLPDIPQYIHIPVGFKNAGQNGLHSPAAPTDDNPLDTANAHNWHCPANEKEYSRSPRKALWQASRELK